MLLIKKLLSHISSPLPVGMTEFNKWASEIIEISGKYADEDSLKFALASMVMHADAKHGHLPKAYFVTRLRKVAANQVASQVFQDVKLKQAEALEAAKKLAEVTASTEETVANEQQG